MTPAPKRGGGCPIGPIWAKPGQSVPGNGCKLSDVVAIWRMEREKLPMPFGFRPVKDDCAGRTCGRIHGIAGIGNGWNLPEAG